MAQISLNSRTFDYTITRKAIRSIRIRLTSNTSFCVFCPRLTPDFVIITFLKANANWIVNQSQKIKNVDISKLEYLNILDDNYRLIFQKSTRDSVVVFQDLHQIHINSIDITPSYLKSLIDKKLRTLALSLIKLNLIILKNQYGFTYGKISVRNQSSRYGSCSMSGNLSFNWQIILFPFEKFRHVLLHELTHTIHHDHSPSFWKLLSSFDPGFRTHRLWLKKEGNKYLIFSNV